MKTLGYNVLTACDGVVALETLAQQDVDLVITDLNMPNMDGYELIRCIRTQEEQRDVPIIMVCSEGRETARQRGLEMGANACLSKPFTMDTIRDAVASSLA